MIEHQRSPAEQQIENWRQLVVATGERLEAARRARDAAIEGGDVDGAMTHQATILALTPVLTKLAEAAERHRGVVTPMVALYAAQIAQNRR